MVQYKHVAIQRAYTALSRENQDSATKCGDWTKQLIGRLTLGSASRLRGGSGYSLIKGEGCVIAGELESEIVGSCRIRSPG
jgi:hypothetical protein